MTTHDQVATDHEVHVTEAPDETYIGCVFCVDVCVWTSTPQKFASEAFEMAWLKRSAIVEIAQHKWDLENGVAMTADDRKDMRDEYLSDVRKDQG